MHPKLAFVYLEVLAEQMASNRQIHPVVDSTLSHLAVSGYTVERLTQALLPSDDLRPHLVDPQVQSDEVEVKMATIALQTVLPHDLAQVPTKKIIKYRNKYRDEMTMPLRMLWKGKKRASRLQQKVWVANTLILRDEASCIGSVRFLPHHNTMKDQRISQQGLL